MRFALYAVAAGACLIGGAATLISASPACEIICAAGALLAGAPVAVFLFDTLRPHDPYRQHRDSPD